MTKQYSKGFLKSVAELDARFTVVMKRLRVDEDLVPKTESDLAETIAATNHQMFRTAVGMANAKENENSGDLMQDFTFFATLHAMMLACEYFLRSSPQWDNEEMIRDQWFNAARRAASNALRPGRVVDFQMGRQQ